MLKNKHNVPKKQWKKWGQISQYLFNSVYDQMITMPHLFIHPKSLPIEDRHWKTTAWNAAWIAAEDLRWLKEE